MTILIHLSSNKYIQHRIKLSICWLTSLAMDNASVVVVSESSSNNNNSVVVPPGSNHEVVIDLGGFDLSDALAMVAGEPGLALAASKSYVSKLPAVEEVKEDDVCSVCMEEQVDSEVGGGNKRIPCGHVYHSECIALWLSLCDSCPLCRRHISLLHC